MARLMLQLVVFALIALVQLSVCVASSCGPTSGAAAQLFEEEEVDDATLVDVVESTATVEHPSARWDVEQHEPAPVHLDRESRPPTA